MRMIERVARAIFAATGPEGCKATHGNFDILMPEIQDDIRNWARAAIEAMRTPTIDMTAEGVFHGVTHDDAEEDVDGIWSAMIEEALK